MAEGPRLLGDPLPRERLLAVPAAGGAIKERPEDFLVDELALYEPSGTGEHLYLRVQKTNLAHNEIVDVLQRHYRVKEEAIGFAGMKDKVAVTQQTVSIHLPGRPDGDLPRHPRLAVLWAARHENKIRRGHLLGNRFAIRIRRIDPLRAPAIRRQLRELERTGIPDYYGFQRFGYRRNNHRLGLLVLRQEWDGLLAELLGTSGSSSPEHQRERAGFSTRARHVDALPMWARATAPSGRPSAPWARGASPPPRWASSSAGRLRPLGHAALQSWLSSTACSTGRIADGLFDRLLEGDGRSTSPRRVFVVAGWTISPRRRSPGRGRDVRSLAVGVAWVRAWCSLSKRLRSREGRGAGRGGP
ncbi:MAG: tRNA pseudouridine(13) synthase TruD [Phycisphaerales bacterium]